MKGLKIVKTVSSRGYAETTSAAGRGEHIIIIIIIIVACTDRRVLRVQQLRGAGGYVLYNTVPTESHASAVRVCLPYFRTLPSAHTLYWHTDKLRCARVCVYLRVRVCVRASRAFFRVCARVYCVGVLYTTVRE